jgi:hypothetical protein
MKPKNRKKVRTDRPTSPELDQTKKSVLNSLTSLQSHRSHQPAMDKSIESYYPEPSGGGVAPWISTVMPRSSRFSMRVAAGKIEVLQPDVTPAPASALMAR